MCAIINPKMGYHFGVLKTDRGSGPRILRGEMCWFRVDHGTVTAQLVVVGAQMDGRTALGQDWQICRYVYCAQLCMCWVTCVGWLSAGGTLFRAMMGGRFGVVRGVQILGPRIPRNEVVWPVLGTIFGVISGPVGSRGTKWGPFWGI